MTRSQQDQDLPDDLLSDENEGEASLRQMVGEVLLAKGAITPDHLRIALHEQKRTGELLGATLVRLGLLNETALANVLAERVGGAPVDLTQALLDPDLLKLLPREVALRCHVLPLRQSELGLEVAMADPYDIVALDEIRRRFQGGLRPTPRVASRADIEAAIERAYGYVHAIDDILRELESGSAEQGAQGEQHPVVRLVDSLLFEAARAGASDIHLEPEKTFVRIRLRLDGCLETFLTLHKDHWPALSHRLKIMAGMNIADTKGIQDGRFTLSIGGGPVDFRVASMPSVWGETIVVRLLDHRRSLLSLEKLGFPTARLSELSQVLARPHGLTLVTGPTGSGKTTTLYSILKKLSTPGVHIATLEEPIEYQLDLVRQTAVQEAQGLTFGAGVRGLLRMDPDILFIGEVRDTDTAQMALRAAMTGHQVFSTLHCNDVLDALPRLIDLGLSPRVLAGNLSGIMAQRLVRALCPACKRTRVASKSEARLLGESETARVRLAEPCGCPNCRGTGFAGRVVVSSILKITPALDDLIAAEAPRSALFAAAREEGFQTLQEDGLARVREGSVSLTELARVVDLSRLMPSKAAP